MTSLELLGLISVGVLFGNIATYLFQILLSIALVKYQNYLMKQQLSLMLGQKKNKKLSVVKDE